MFSPVAATGKCHLALRFHFVAFLTPGVGRAAVVRLAGWPRCAVGCALGLAGGARTSSDPRASITRDRGWAVTLCALRAPAIARSLSAALRCRPGSWARQPLQDGSDPREVSVGAWLKDDIGLMLGPRTQGRAFPPCSQSRHPLKMILRGGEGGKSYLVSPIPPEHSIPHQTQTPTEAGVGEEVSCPVSNKAGVPS